MAVAAVVVHIGGAAAVARGLPQGHALFARGAFVGSLPTALQTSRVTLYACLQFKPNAIQKDLKDHINECEFHKKFIKELGLFSN